MIAGGGTTLTDDLLSDLIRAEDDGDRLTHSELLMLASGLLMAGTDTTRNQVAAAVYALCDHPDQWALLAEHPELAPNAVEEMLRHSPDRRRDVPHRGRRRRTRGVTHPGRHVRRRQRALRANRDPAVFDDPDRLDITPASPRRLLTFGGGVHYCLGSHLARAELVEALTVMHAPHAQRRVAPDPPRGSR